MKIKESYRQEYIETKSHVELADKLDISLLSLDTYAKEHGWDKEHKLYWRDVALQVLKKETEASNISAVKELLKAVGHTRPVGRPPKEEVDRQIAIEANIAKEYEADADRMANFRVVR